MITNSQVTIYHKYLDEATHLEKWKSHHFKAWVFGGKGARIDKGYDNANDVEIRIPYNENNIDMGLIAIGDIVVRGKVTLPIKTQQDLKGYEFYNIMSIKNNTFGSNPHVHLGGK